jgi:hypothetical protein
MGTTPVGARCRKMTYPSLQTADITIYKCLLNYLFNLDLQTEEIVVSNSLKESFKIETVERIAKNNHAILFHAVSA